MSNEMELRFVEATEVRVEDGDNGSPPKLVGYAAVFGGVSQDLGGFREVIRPGAFSDTLQSGEDVRALVSHNPDQLLARTSSGTLRLSEDGQGLRFDMDVPDTSYARDMLALVKRGDIKGMSFGFKTPKGGDSWAKGPDGQILRTLNKVNIREISVVANPAYRQTSLAVRVDPACAAHAAELAGLPGKLARRAAIRQLLASI